MQATHLNLMDERLNRGASALNHGVLRRSKVFSVSLFGGPGCGKTALLENTLRQLEGKLRAAAIVGNLQAHDDAQRLGEFCHNVVPIETIDLDALLLREALLHLDLNAIDILFIERAAEAPSRPWDLGQSATVGMFSLSGGDAVVRRHPQRVEHADLLILSKLDLLPFVPFDMSRFHNSVRSMNPNVPMLGVSNVTGQGLDAWCQWIMSRVQRQASPEITKAAEYFMG